MILVAYKQKQGQNVADGSSLQSFWFRILWSNNEGSCKEEDGKKQEIVVASVFSIRPKGKLLR